VLRVWAAPPTPAARGAPQGAAVVVAEAPIQVESGEVILGIVLPTGYHFTKGANSRFEVLLEPADTPLRFEPVSGSLQEGGKTAARIRFKRTGTALPGSLIRVNCKIYYCQDEDVCLFQQVSFEVPLAPSSSKGALMTEVIYSVPVPRSASRQSSLIFDD